MTGGVFPPPIYSLKPYLYRDGAHRPPSVGLAYFGQFLRAFWPFGRVGSRPKHPDALAPICPPNRPEISLFGARVSVISGLAPSVCGCQKWRSGKHLGNRPSRRATVSTAGAIAVREASVFESCVHNRPIGSRSPSDSPPAWPDFNGAAPWGTRESRSASVRPAA